MIIRHRDPVEESFILWMDGHPESFHACDMRRFYVFVKSVYSYRKKSWEEFEFFKKNLMEINPLFADEHICTFFNKLREGITLLRTACFPKYTFEEGGDARATTERRVVGGRTVDSPSHEAEKE